MQVIKKQHVGPYRSAFPVCTLTRHPTQALRMTPSTSVNSNPRAAPGSHDLEQWLRTEHVAGKMKCYGILGPVITGQQGRFIQPVCSSRGQSQAVQMDVRPNQTPTLLSLQLTRQLHHGHIWKGVFRKELLALQ